MTLNWNFLRGLGVQAKNLLLGGYGYFLKQHNTLHLSNTCGITQMLNQNTKCSTV